MGCQLGERNEHNNNSFWMKCEGFVCLEEDVSF